MPDPLWINASAGAPAYDATELRQAMALALAHGGGQNLGARSGVRPGGTQLETSLAGTTITVQEGVACLYEPTPSAARAPYWVCLPADETHTLTAAHATNPRKDITVLRVYDHDQDTSGLRLARSEYLVGTAAPSPVEPTVPAGAFRLATIDVPPSGGGSPAVTINHPFTVATGGILPIRNAAEESALSPYNGMVIARLDTETVKVRLGGAWQEVLVDQEGLTVGLRPTLLTTPDSTFPNDTTATSSEVVQNRLTVPSAPYARVLTVHAVTFLNYTQDNNTIDARLYVNTTRIDTDRKRLVTASAIQSFNLNGKFQLAASTAGVVEVRIVRITGTGLVSASSNDNVLQVTHQRAA